ncbi:MAG: FAD-dependent oxidoreductase, partial [Comamonadaceae bacterium]
RTTTTPADVDRTVGPEETRTMYRDFVAPRFPRIGGAVIQARACMYTVAPDRHFVIDTLADAPQALIASACSGHGFKHSAGLGEAIALQLTGDRQVPALQPFRRERLQPGGLA